MKIVIYFVSYHSWLLNVSFVMGSFAGHAVPGAFFILYGTAWILNFLCYHFKTSKSALKVSGEGRFKREKVPSSSFFEFKRDHDLSKKSWVPITATRFPVEPLLKILVPILGVIVEAFFDYRMRDGHKHLVVSAYSVTDGDGKLNDMGKLHHITMYSSFVLSGVMDLVTLCIRLPRQTSMLFLMLSFVVEFVLFYFHTAGRNELNIAIHSLLTYSILACIVFSLLRVFNAVNVVINLGLGSSILLQGTWFIQAGYFLFVGFLDEKNPDGSSDKDADEDTDITQHRYLMLVAACYTWHLLLIALGNIVAWVALAACLRNRVLRRRTLKRRGLLASLRQGLPGGGGMDEERNKLIVEEANDGLESGIEMQHMAETHT